MSEALAALLKDLRREAGWENTSGARAAALAIAGLPGDEPLRALIAELERADTIDLTDDAGDVGDELWRLRQAIEAALLEMGARAVQYAAPTLHAARATPRDQVLGRVCARGHAHALFPVFAAWLELDDAEFTALECLGHLGDPRGTALIRKVLERGPRLNDGWRKRIAASALARLGDATALHVLLDDADWFARLGAIDAAPLLTNEHDRAQLLARGKADTDERVRKAAEGAER